MENFLKQSQKIFLLQNFLKNLHFWEGHVNNIWIEFNWISVNWMSKTFVNNLNNHEFCNYLKTISQAPLFLSININVKF